MTTGAFEISIDRELVYSKIDTGRMPEMPEIHSLLQLAGLKFN
jgi:selT/selW/selH-like putative selenoprotein